MITGIFLLMLAAALRACPAIAGARDRPHHSPLVLSVNAATRGFPRKAFAKERDESLESCCERLMSAKRSIYYLNARSYKMAFQLRAIYARDETMFFCLGLSNHSHINYSVDSIRFYIADEKQAARPAFAGRAAPGARGPAMIPLCICGNTRIIRGKTREFCVFALPRFTLPAKKLLVIDVSERNGGRHLQLLADNYLLVRARLV